MRLAAGLAAIPGAVRLLLAAGAQSEGVGFGLGLGLSASFSFAAAACAAAAHRRQRRRGAARRGGATAVAALVEQPVLEGPKMRVVVFGGTGYIGRATVKELAARGHSVVVLTRDRSGIGGEQSLDDVRASFSEDGGVEVIAGDVTDEASLSSALASLEPKVEAGVCCLASRSGGRQDSFDVDYQATMNCSNALRKLGGKQFVLLSAVCVQRPKLAFQEAKLQAEQELAKHGDEMAYSIVQPTAFFKSLLGQVKGVKGGAPFVMFGDGTQVSCKPISEQDLAAYISDCLWDPKKKNATLPIGGPGDAMSFKEQGELLFSLLNKEPSFICVPYWIFDVVQGVIEFFTGKDSDTAEYGRIGRYYAEESMLVLDPATGAYSGELTPSYGKTSLRDFLTEALAEGSTKLEEQKLGEQGLGSRVGLSEQ